MMHKLFGISIAAFPLLAGVALAAPAMEADSSLGKILVDHKGMTLYTFDKDEMGKSNCYDKCAANWPPFLAAVDAQPEGEWTIIERTDGTKQWAYDGKPLYLWVKDTKPGDVTGDMVNDVWHVVKAD
jgi:predicted lipoprotein with Yx(FWY)xxD motif